MELAKSHISYCSNIHPGEGWQEHFNELKTNVPLIKERVSPNKPFGLGLRLSAKAAEELSDSSALSEFKEWLARHDLYVFTMNGFPYGDFHLKRVKDQVHAPDWTTKLRLNYTKRLFDILVQLLPEHHQGGISTSPLSYRFWHNEGDNDWKTKRQICTQHILEVADHLYQKETETSFYMHLDIEPEPDGMIENAAEFISWYLEELLPLGQAYFHERYGLEPAKSIALIKRYICLCYDVCHFALEYEDHALCMNQLSKAGIAIGKFQVSSALKVKLASDRQRRDEQKKKLQEFDEPIYLHQVIAKDKEENLIKYRDLADAFADNNDNTHTEWRSHFHVPIFLESYGELGSTQDDIREVMHLHQLQPRTKHIEVETYTWGVLPKSLQIPIHESIARELNWLVELLNSKTCKE